MSGKIKLHFELKEAKEELLKAIEEHFLKVMEVKNPDENCAIATSSKFIFMEMERTPLNETLAKYLVTIGQMAQGGV